MLTLSDLRGDLSDVERTEIKHLKVAVPLLVVSHNRAPCSTLLCALLKDQPIWEWACERSFCRRLAFAMQPISQSRNS